MSGHLSTREEILMMLKTKGSLTVSDMSKELGITEMAVRRHLNTLERDELIKSSIVRQSMGRPTNMYSLTEKADNHFPKAYKNLANDILDGILDDEGPEKINEIFEKRELRLRKNYLSKMQGLISLDEKVHKLIDIQNEKGYMVDWEETKEGYYIKEYNCPISDISRKYTNACDGEKKLFQNVLNADVENVKCMARGDSSCVYLVKKNKGE